MAAPDGSFILIIDAAVGDAIALVLINLGGEEISDRTVVIVPAISSAVETGECAGLGLSGQMIDVAIPNGSKMALHEGDELFTNRIVTDAGAYALPGCVVTDMDVILGTNEGDKIVVISEEESTVWVGTWDGATFTSANSFTLEEPPLKVVSYGDHDHVAIAYTLAGKYVMGRLNLSTGIVDKIKAAPEPTSSHVFTDIVAMRSFGPFADNGYVIALVLAGADSSGTNYFINFFETSNFVVSSLDFAPLNINDITGNAGLVVEDASLSNGIKSADDIAMLFVDSHNKVLWLGILYANIGGTFVRVDTINYSAAEFANNLRVDISLQTLIPITGLAPKRIVVANSEGATETVPVAYILVEDVLNAYSLWTYAGFAYAVDRGNFAKTLTDAADPLMIAIDQNTRSLVVGDGATNAAVDISSEWYSDF